MRCDTELEKTKSQRNCMYSSIEVAKRRCKEDEYDRWMRW